jgi:hypothetical protein
MVAITGHGRLPQGFRVGLACPHQRLGRLLRRMAEAGFLLRFIIPITRTGRWTWSTEPGLGDWEPTVSLPLRRAAAHCNSTLADQPDGHLNDTKALHCGWARNSTTNVDANLPQKITSSRSPVADPMRLRTCNGRPLPPQGRRIAGKSGPAAVRRAVAANGWCRVSATVSV